jgi:hypothetical protein
MDRSEARAHLQRRVDKLENLYHGSWPRWTYADFNSVSDLLREGHDEWIGTIGSRYPSVSPSPSGSSDGGFDGGSPALPRCGHCGHHRAKHQPACIMDDTSCGCRQFEAIP